MKLSGHLVDLHRRRVFPGTVTWENGVITAIKPGKVRADAPFIAPGFVDSHIHIESSMLPPAEFARWAVVHGTVATVSDPHEIANVLGAAGVSHMIADGKRTPFKFYFGAPSCVPATPFETAGAELGPRAVDRLMARPDIVYLSEFMNFPAVLRRDADAMAKIASAHKRGKPVDGHAPGLRGKDAAHYAAAGITTDHECFTLDEALDKIAAGMRILIREGSAARNFDALVSLLKTHPASCHFCCDDQHPDELLKGHIDNHVRRALASGADRFDVLRAASVNPVEHYKLDVGLLRVGDAADFITFDSFDDLRVTRTWLNGEVVAENGRTLLPRQKPKIVNRFKAKPRTAAEFAVPLGKGKLNVIGALDGQLITKHLRLAPKSKGGLAVSDTKRDVLKIAVVNRYAEAAPVSLGFIQGVGLKAGALASSVAHDSHNIVAVGVDDESLAAAVNLVIQHRGGVAAVGKGTEKILPLPIAGLMTDLDGPTAARDYAAVDAFAKELGSGLAAPFMTLSFMALTVIPDLKMSDLGLFSGTKGGFVPLFE